MSNSKPINVHQVHELILKLESAGFNGALAQKVIESKDNNLAKEIMKAVTGFKLLRIEIKGLSLRELYEKYGKADIEENGKWENRSRRKREACDEFYGFEYAGSYRGDPKFLQMDYADEKPEPGIYEISPQKQFTKMTKSQQKNALPAGFDFPHPAVLAEAIFNHRDNWDFGSEWPHHLLSDWYSRTSRDCELGYSGGALDVNASSADLNKSSIYGVAPTRKIA